MTSIDLNRREFMRAGIAGAAGLTIAIHLPGCAAPGDRAPAPTPFRPNAWLRVGTDGGVVVVVDKSEMGQGVLTSLPQIIVEELDGDWSMVRIEQAPAGPEYINQGYGIQATGGSRASAPRWDRSAKPVPRPGPCWLLPRPPSGVSSLPLVAPRTATCWRRMAADGRATVISPRPRPCCPFRKRSHSRIRRTSSS